MQRRCHEGDRNGSVKVSARRSGSFARTCLSALVVCAVCAAVAACALENRTVRKAVDGVEIHVARHEDTLLDLAVRHKLGFIELAMANPGVDPWLPGEGTPILLPKLHLPPDAPPRGIVLNLPEQRLYHYEGGRLLRSYPIGIGRDGHATPIGSTTIVRKQENPTWHPTASARNDDPTLPAAVPPGPDNPLGGRAMYLGWTSYLIHGTNKEYGIGRRTSRGCIRMYSDDAVALYDRVAVGTPVTVVDQPIKIGWLGDDLYIEASPTISQVRHWEEKGRFARAQPGNVRRLVLKKPAAAADRIDWTTVDRAVRERRGIPTRITRPLATPMMASVAKSDDEDPLSGLVKWLRRQLSSGH
jgi:L,D-transpeptidase ErfK/SrfK